MVQVDVFWSYAIGAGFGIAAVRNRMARDRPESSPSPTTRLDDPYLNATMLYLGCLFAPSGIWLLWRFTGWETMYAAAGPQDLPAWLVAAFAATNVTQGVAGYLVTQTLWRRGHRYLAWLQMPLGYFAMFFILAYGWDGTGYRRFFAPTAEAWRSGRLDIPAFLTSDVAITLYLMGLVLLPVLILLQSSWMVRGFRASGVAGPGRASLIGLGLLAAFGLGLGLATTCAILLQVCGVPVGLAAATVVLIGVLHPRGPAGRLAAAFRIDAVAERDGVDAAPEGGGLAVPS